MKKILLATSAVALFAGAAAAEVTVSGSARMGIVHNYFDDDGSAAVDTGLPGDVVETRFSSRFRVVFTASGESDSGFSFGASVRNDQSGVGNDKNGDSTVWISGGFGKLTMGDTGDALDSVVGQVSGVGYTGAGDYNEIGFISRDVTGAMYEYSTDTLTFALGMGQIDDVDLPAVATDDDYISAAVKYNGGTWSVALGYAENDSNDEIQALGSVTFGAATVKLKLADRDSATDMAAALSVDYVAGATTITAFATDNQDFAGRDTIGLGASYDLGGGAAVKGGIVDNGTDTVGDLGMTFSF